MNNNTNTATDPQVSLVVIPKAVWEEVVSNIQYIKDGMDNGNKANFADEWIESEVARKQLGICQKTWQTYRDRRYIPFAQFGRKIYIKRSDLHAFMEKNYIASKN